MRQYHELLKHIIAHGEEHDDRTGVGTLSVFGYQTRFDLRDGFPLTTTKKLPFRWIAEELFWFLRGSTDEQELETAGVDIWKEWATEDQTGRFGRHIGDLGPVYGWLWRRFGAPYEPFGGKMSHRRNQADGVDQISRLLRDVAQAPTSRRLLVTGWDPRECDNVALPPCHTLWQIKIHQNQYMSLHLYARSIDSFLGLPFNIASYALLLTLIAYVSGYEPKELVISFGDLHIYKNHMKQVEEQLSRQPQPLPELIISQDVKGNTYLDKLLSVNWNNLQLIGYDPHPSIKAEVAV
jgi:thymidylate synthase